MWCNYDPNLFDLLWSYVPCSLISCPQFNLYSSIPVIEMWSRLWVASRIHLTNLSKMPETQDSFLLWEDENQTQQIYQQLHHPFLRGCGDLSIISVLHIWKCFPYPSVFSPQKKTTLFFYIFLIIFVALLLPSGLVPTFLAIELLKLGIVLLLKPYCSWRWKDLYWICLHFLPILMLAFLFK